MYRVEIDGSPFGSSRLEGSDAPMGCVSGELITTLSPSEVTKFMQSNGASDNGGLFQIDFTGRVAVFDNSGDPIEHSGCCVIWAPELDELLIDVLGIAYPEYEQLFPHHVESYRKQFQSSEDE